MGSVERGSNYTGNVLIRNASDQLVDPDTGTLILTIKDPAGAVILTVPQATLTRLAQGNFAYTWAVAAGLATGVYPWNWNASQNGAVLPTATEDVVVVLAGSLGTTFVPVASVRALITSSLTDSQLSDLIAREEAILAAKIGPLTGPRTEIVTITEASYGLPVTLRRPTAAVTITEGGTAVTDILIGPDGRRITRLTATGWATATWLGVVEATYTPSDSALVASWVIELVRARLAETGYESESIGDYSYSRGTGRTHRATLALALSEILERRNGLTSIRMTTGSSSGPAWVGSVRP